MANFNLQTHLKQVHKDRRTATTNKVDEAIQRLVRANENINFNSVASEAGVAKATLYNNLVLRERIETLRQQQAIVPSKKQVQRKMNDNNKDALIDSLKRKIKRIEQENKDLKGQLKVAYAEIYRKI
ncbi:DUF6262 family protein [Peribacillus castrilensis]|uniref:DUF6262 family protein n=1 Tax=Peribacillus TaxID=2675229 RepID=UPI000D0007F1|nr:MULTISPECIES: DUF6262 family protein [Peribacillus]MCF7624518.1 DUF6262 family protein [Peribacillus frigoritolerans]PRA78204.1 transposase [Peribacillus simplex]